MTDREALKRISDAGFRFIKVEFEAELNFKSDFRQAVTDDERPHATIQRYIDRCKPFPLTYSKVYNDGTVNTELTLTFALEHAPKLPELVKVWNRAVRSVSDGVSTKNAGMHIALLKSSGYQRRPLSPLNDRIGNRFAREVGDPAVLAVLYLLGSRGTGLTRAFHYRGPKVSHHDKYSAIYTHNFNCLEYRLFDPCYHDPERTLHFLKVIAATLKFWKRYMLYASAPALTDLKRKIDQKFEDIDYNETPFFHVHRLFEDVDDREARELCREAMKKLGIDKERQITDAFNEKKWARALARVRL